MCFFKYYRNLRLGGTAAKKKFWEKEMISEKIS